MFCLFSFPFRFSPYRHCPRGGRPTASAAATAAAAAAAAVGAADANHAAAAAQTGARRRPRAEQARGQGALQGRPVGGAFTVHSC